MVQRGVFFGCYRMGSTRGTEAMTTGLGPFWSRSGVMFVRADAATIGPSESLPAIKSLGYGWVAYDCSTGEWDAERKIAARVGLDVVAWRRTRTVADALNLETAARRWKAPAIIPNVEIPDTRQAGLMGAVAAVLSRIGRGLVVTDGWADPSGTWAPVKRWVVSPECFPEEFRPFADVTGCVEHARSKTTRESLPCLGAYGTSWRGRLPMRLDYQWPLTRPFIVYPGDSVTNWQQWNALTVKAQAA